MNGDLKLSFIQQCLEQYMKEVAEVMRIAAKRANVGITGEGIKSIAYEVLQTGSGGTAKLSFKDYLRMVDMGVGRAHPLGGLDTMRVVLFNDKKGYKQVKDKVRKPKKIYSKPAYGKLTWLENKLLHGFTDEAVNAIKSQLQQNNISTS